MPDVQPEGNFTIISNDILEALAATRIKGEAMQVLLVIVRKTYGWHKKNDDISLSQFVEATGINKQNVSRAIKRLKNMNMIFIQKDNDSLSKKITATCNYAVNQDISTWKPLSKKITTFIKKDNVIKKDKGPLSKKTPTKETITKENTTPLTPQGEEIESAKLKQTCIFGDDPPPKPPLKSKHQKPAPAPVTGVMDLYNEILADEFPMPHANNPDTYEEDIRVRWSMKDRSMFEPEDWELGKRFDSLEWWGSFFKRVSYSPFLTNREVGSKGSWKCNLKWILKKENFLKILEGNYHDQK